MKKIVLFLLFPLILSCKSKPIESANTSAKMGQKAPDFQLPTPNGKKIRLSDYEGKVVLLDFWATWCGPCRMSTPVMSRINEKYKGQDVVVLGVSLDEDVSDVKPYIEKNNIKHTIALGANSNIGSIYKVRGIPSFFLIDKSGMIQKAFPGFHPDFEAEWIKEIDALLAKS